ncbi:MAG: hypothetical protein K1X53_12220 [Candidatus Sumerlaeaceae bacterium]|nr:hypothetical protein [Candidatus Sumerlaeaceae bacterium]
MSNRIMRNSLKVALVALLLALPGLPALAQTAAQPPAEPTGEQLRNMSREERLKLHQEKIRRIIDESKKKQEEDAKKAAEAQKTTVTPAPGAPAAGQPTPIPVPGQAFPAGPVQAYTPPQPGAAPTPAGPAAPRTVRNESKGIMYFRPFDSVVHLGDTFKTDIVADTKEGDVDEITFLIRYPKKTLNPLAVDYSEISGIVKDAVEYSTDPETGEIFMRLPLQQPHKFAARSIAKIIWEAIGPTDGEEINFEFGKGLTTGLFIGGQNSLGSFTGNDGVIHSSVVVRPPKGKPIVQQVGKGGLLVATNRLEISPASMAIRLVGPKVPVSAGDEFTVTLVLDNPAGAAFDRLQAFVQFDPKDLEVVDWDNQNYIKDSVNINDGFARDTFAFDFLGRNSVDNKKGNIVYDKACEAQPLKVSGPFAKIKFKAKHEADRTDVVLVANNPGVGPTTDVSFHQSSMLKSAPKTAMALDGVAITVDEARAQPVRVAQPGAGQAELPRRAVIIRNQ